MHKKIKYAFFGTPDLVISILDELKKSDILPSLIITGPDVAKGRKLIVTAPTPKIWAEKRGIPVLQPQKIDSEFVANFAKHDFDLAVVVAYGKILPEALINAPKHGMINVHYSLLPKYRGATPVESAILNGEKETGVCIQKMVYALDAGDMIAEAKIEIGEEEKAIHLRDRLNEKAKSILPNTIHEVVSGTAKFTKQDESLATHCKKIKKEDGLINLEDNGLVNYRKFKAYFGWPGTFFFVEKNGKQIRVKITDASYRDGEFKILQVIPEGKNEISYTSFRNGNGA